MSVTQVRRGIQTQSSRKFPPTKPTEPPTSWGKSSSMRRHHCRSAPKQRVWKSRRRLTFVNGSCLTCPAISASSGSFCQKHTAAVQADNQRTGASWNARWSSEWAEAETTSRPGCCPQWASFFLAWVKYSAFLIPTLLYVYWIVICRFCTFSFLTFGEALGVLFPDTLKMKRMLAGMPPLIVRLRPVYLCNGQYNRKCSDIPFPFALRIHEGDKASYTELGIDSMQFPI